MSRRSNNNQQLVQVILRLWRSTAVFPATIRYGLLGMILLAVLVWITSGRQLLESISAPVSPIVTGNNPDGSSTLLFCAWNVENLFDDKVDKGRRAIDRPFDLGFAEDDKVRQHKLDQLADALLKINGGVGPDIISCVEVESVRAADLLRATLNKKLDEAKTDSKLKYTQIAMKNIGNDAGRHIAPAIITRLNVSHPYTKLHGRNLRILETRLFVNGHQLCLLSAHWTSQLRQRDGTDGDSGRAKYGSTIAEVYESLFQKNPKVDVIVSGDFNDIPEADPVVKSLRAIGDKQKVINSPEPYLLNLLSGKPASQFGTLWYGGRSLIYDHICVSPGMLDTEGWSVEPDSIQTYSAGLIAPGATRREPWRFGDPDNEPRNGRGFSDHFPVLVKLTLQPAKNREKKPE